MSTSWPLEPNRRFVCPSPFTLRHSEASLSYAATKDMKATAARLGHTSTRMIDTVYLSLYDEVGRHVADAIDELVRASAARETDANRER